MASVIEQGVTRREFLVRSATLAGGAFLSIGVPPGLRSGEVAEVEIASKGNAAPAAKGFLIPAISLIDARADQGMVYVVSEDGKATRRAVQLEGLVDGGVVVVARLNDEFTVKTFRLIDGLPWLYPANENYEPIEITEGADFEVWGCVTFAITSLK